MRNDEPGLSFGSHVHQLIGRRSSSPETVGAIKVQALAFGALIPTFAGVMRWLMSDAPTRDRSLGTVQTLSEIGVWAALAVMSAAVVVLVMPSKYTSRLFWMAVVPATVITIAFVMLAWHASVGDVPLIGNVYSGPRNGIDPM